MKDIAIEIPLFRITNDDPVFQYVQILNELHEVSQSQYFVPMFWWSSTVKYKDVMNLSIDHPFTSFFYALFIHSLRNLLVYFYY